MPEGYRTFLSDGRDYGVIFLDDWRFELQETNIGRARCKVCKSPIPKRECITRWFVLQIGWKRYNERERWCLDCVRRKILEFSELGFTRTLKDSRLEACTIHHGRYSAQEVADGIQMVATPVIKFVVVTIGERIHVPGPKPKPKESK